MKSRSVCQFLLIVGLFILVTPLVWADEPSNAALKAEIRALKSRLNQLEAKMAKVEEAPAAYQAPAAGISLPSGLQGIELSGYVSTSAIYNFNEQNNFGNSGRVFDYDSGFTPHAFELVIQKPVTDDLPVGFRGDLFFGEDAEVFGATGLGSTTDEIELQQAFITYRAPLGNGLDVKVGKFVTLLGAEVIESKDNWNFSRSYMFGYSIPFTHTGILTTYPWTEWLSTTFGVVNGWEVVDDNNKAKTMLGNITLGPWNNLTLSINPVYGAEQGNDDHDQRAVISNVLSWTPTDQLAFMFNWDYGREEDALSETGGGNASWQGYAFYAKYSPLDWYSVANRIEWFNDQDAVRVAPTPARAALAGSGHGDISFFEWTLTNEFKLHEHLIARLEYRLDKADADVFRHDQGAKDYMNTIAAELIVPF